MSPFFNAVKKNVLEQFPAESFEFQESYGDEVILCETKNLTALLSMLKTKHKCDFLMNVSGIDFPEKQKRFEVCYELFSSSMNSRVRVKVAVNEEESIPTAQFIWKTADWFEREAYDMFGIQFSDHPNLKRLLTHHQFKGHPLRKDYPADRVTTLYRSFAYPF